MWSTDIISPVMPLDGMVKLTNEEIKWLTIRLGSGFFTVNKAAVVYGVTELITAIFMGFSLRSFTIRNWAGCKKKKGR